MGHHVRVAKPYNLSHPEDAVTSLTVPNDIRCKTHPLCVNINLGILFEYVLTSWVVLEERQSMDWSSDRGHFLMVYFVVFSIDQCIICMCFSENLIQIFWDFVKVTHCFVHAHTQFPLPGWECNQQTCLRICETVACWETAGHVAPGSKVCERHRLWESASCWRRSAKGAVEQYARVPL